MRPLPEPILAHEEIKSRNSNRKSFGRRKVQGIPDLSQVRHLRARFRRVLCSQFRQEQAQWSSPPVSGFRESLKPRIEPGEHVIKLGIAVACELVQLLDHEQGIQKSLPYALEDSLDQKGRFARQFLFEVHDQVMKRIVQHQDLAKAVIHHSKRKLLIGASLAFLSLDKALQAIHEALFRRGFHSRRLLALRNMARDICNFSL